MSYEPTIWENGKTPINADNLNKIENELSLLSTNTEALQSEIDEAKADIEELKNKVDVDITEGSTKTLPNSFNGGLRFTEMLGASEQDGTPTPDNPQEIKSVSISEMKTHGKNLYNGTYANKYDLFIPANTPFTVSTNSGEPPSHFYIYDSAGNQIDYWALTNQTTLNGVSRQYRTFNFTYDIYSVAFRNRDNGDYQIEFGTVATPYEPYQESVATLSNFKLNGIGNVKDRLFKKDGLWQIERKIGEVDLSTLAWGRSSDDKSWYNTELRATGIFKYNEVTWMCDNWLAHVWTGQFNGCIVCDGSKIVYCITEDSVNKPTGTLIYVLMDDKVTYEVLPLADQVALNSLLTFDGTTYLDIESVLEPQFTLEYGTSKVGGYTLQSLNTAEANNARLNAMETYTNDLANAIL